MNSTLVNDRKNKLVRILIIGLMSILFLSINKNKLFAQHGVEPHPVDAVQAILSKFDNYSLVGLGMSHRQQDEADFSLTLVRDPRFAAKVKNVVVECGNSLYQPVLDRYINGEDIPLEQIQLVWRNTTQPGAGDCRQHKELLDAVREVNRHLSKNQRIRVWAGDPPIDWDKIKRPEDYAPFLNQRDSNFASIVIDQVLAKHQKALLIIGAGHILKRPISWSTAGTDTLAPNVTMLIEKKYHHSIYVIAPHDDFGSRNAELEPRLAKWAIPSLSDIHGTWVGLLEAGVIYEGKIRRVGSDPSQIQTPFPGLQLQDIIDGYLYLGPIATIKQVEYYSETGTPYARELERRRKLLGGGPAPMAPVSIPQKP